MRRRNRYALIRRPLAQLPGRQAYPSEVAQAAGLDRVQTWMDMERMARKRRGVRKIPGHTRFEPDQG